MPYVHYIVLGLYAAAMLMSIVLHEVAHGWMARRCGDYTAEAAGRLSLNPLRHIDPFMTILLPILVFWASHGQRIFGGAKPVPVNPYMFRNLEIDDLKVSLAGVAVNFVLAYGCGMTLHFWEPNTIGAAFFTLITLGNLSLALFNLIPIPPLDGSHVARFVLARVAPPIAEAYERLSFMGLILVFMLASLFSRPMEIATTFFWDKVLGLSDTPWEIILAQFWRSF